MVAVAVCIGVAAAADDRSESPYAPAAVGSSDCRCFAGGPSLLSVEVRLGCGLACVAGRKCWAESPSDLHHDHSDPWMHCCSAGPVYDLDPGLARDTIYDND